MKPPKYRLVAALLCSTAVAILMMGTAIAQQQQEPSWKWPESKVFETVNRVRAGRDLTPKRWPRGARVAVGLSFDFDNETPSLRDGLTSPALMAQGEDGARAGLPRILRLLDKYHAPATFFIPAISAKLHRQGVRDIVSKQRHEIGVHGWIHERNSLLEEADERELMRRSIEALTQILFVYGRLVRRRRGICRAGGRIPVTCGAWRFAGDCVAFASASS